MGADTKANTRGGGALEGGDLRLLEDGSECGSALVSDGVVIETAKHGRGWGGERRGVSMGADTKANTSRAVAYSRVVICVSLRMAASAEAPLSSISLSLILHSMGEVGAVRGRSVNGR